MFSKIIDYGMNGEGIAKVDGKTFFVPNAILGEDVEFEVELDKGNYAFAKLLKIISPSENRVTPVCPYEDCGGCQLKHMAYEEQLKFKTSLVQKTLKKVADLHYSVSPCVPCENQFFYRNKSSFTFTPAGSGFLKESSHEVVEIEKCVISSENVNKVFSLIKKYVNSKKIKPYNKETHEGQIKNLVVRDINNQILVGVVCNEEIELKDFYELLNSNFEKIGLFKIINTRNDSTVLTNKCQLVGGLDKIDIENLNLKYSVDLLGFHQTNLDIQNKLYQKVLDEISSSSVVLNGFSGAGFLTALLAKKCKYVYGIDINPSSFKSAEKLKSDNNISNMMNIEGDFFKKFKELKSQIDTIVLDPSKKGCGEKVMNQICGTKNIIYISCNPIALSKDLRILKDKYFIEEIVPFDMFPNTTSVETFVKLTKID